MKFQGTVSASSNKHPLVVWLPAASQCFQKARVANFKTSLSFYSCVTIGRESIAHSACRVLHCACFWSSDKSYTMLLPGRDVQRWDERGDSPGQPRQKVIQRVKLQKVHLSKSC